ncbi:MAG: serine protease [Deinococcales bacterium]
MTKLVVGAAILGSSASAQNLTPELYEAIIKASVQFVCFDQSGRGLWQGSGSFIGREGIILTNNHVVASEQTNQVCPILRISVVQNEDQPPEPRYVGRVIARLPNVDLALVQISSDLRGNPVPVGTRFPAVPLGDSDAVRVGERIFNFGFPDINGTSETITVSSGSVNGFLENRGFMKHDALSGPGGSGGGIYNLRGELVAVHSAGVSGNNNTRQPLGRPLVLGLPMIQQHVRGFGEPWATQLASGFNPPVVTAVSFTPTQPPLLPPTNSNQPPT